jgi:actin-like ATPase involved in cell morphogenesis
MIRNLAFLIGCGQYDDPDISELRYADKDVDCFAEIIASNSNFHENEIIRLSSNQTDLKYLSNKNQIIRELSKGDNFVKNGIKINLLFFFFSGHGFHSPRDNKEYLVLKDSVSTEIEDTSIAFDSVIKYLNSWNAKSIVLFLDACRSSIHGGKSIADENPVDISSLYSKGMVSFCSCSPREKSYESSELEKSIFTHALSEAFSDDGKCKTVYELDNYLIHKLPVISKKFGKPIQHPYTKVEPLSMLDVVLVSEQTLNRWDSLPIVGHEVRTSFKNNGSTTFSSKQDIICAVDFGTSFSIIAFLDETQKVKSIPSSDGKSLVPSVISFTDDLNYFVGSKAIEHSLTKPQNTIFNVKRYLGSETKFNIGGKSFSPEFIASLIIKSLKQNAEEFLSTEIKKVLISMPANFTIAESNALAIAFELAGLEIVRMIGEPCAASLLVALHRNDFPSIEYNEYCLVLDLGGGTFDVSVVSQSLEKDFFSIEAVAGDNYLGGMDYDEVIQKYIISQIQSFAKASDYTLSEFDKARVQIEAKRVKSLLNSTQEAIILFQDCEIGEFGLQDIEIRISRDLFRNLTALLNSEIERCILQVLKTAKLELKHIIYVLLAGQGSKIFTVPEIIARLFPNTSVIEKFQENAVVQGLSLQASLLNNLNNNIRGDFLLLDSTYTSIGVKCVTNKPDSEEEEIDCIVSQKDEDNLETLIGLHNGITIPTLKIIRNIKVFAKNGDKISLKIVEVSADGREYLIGNIRICPIMTSLNLELLLDCNSNRTIVLWLRKPDSREILGFQVNHFFTQHKLDKSLPFSYEKYKDEYRCLFAGRLNKEGIDWNEIFK